MKKLKLNLSVLPVFILMMAWSLTGFGQAPYFMSYQAVVRNASNNLVVNAPVGMKVSILQGTADGVAVFEETHTATTDANGLVTIQIGNGTNVSGAIATVVWTAGPFFIKTETDPAGGTDYSITATSQLMSVPYALYAENSGSSTPGPQGPEGPMGPAGPEGPQGPAGQGMTVNCLECHNHNPATASGMAAILANASKEIKYSQHAMGEELAIGEGGSAGCAPCHSNEGFHSVVDNNTVPTYTLGGNGKYTFSYNAAASASSGLTTMPSAIGCFTCHKGAATDSMALYSTAPVPMVMWSFPTFAQTIDLPQKDAQSNLCVKCHQPRTVNVNGTLSNGASVDFPDLVANPTNMFYDSAVGNAVPNKLMPSYRFGIHYGTVGAVFAGKGAVEFEGSMTIGNSTHTTVASCQDCHMATPTSTTGGHSFWVTSEFEGGSVTNFKGCNASGCHSNVSATSNSRWVNPRANITDLLVSLADKLKANGVDILHKDTDPESNKWASVTPEGYDGYLDVYDASSNPGGAWRNPAPSNSWSNDQKTYNLSLPKFPSLLNVQLGAIINFQLFLREYSRGIHNYAYSESVLTNSIDALTAAGF